MSESLFEQYKAALRRGHMAALAGALDDALAAYDAAGRLVPERALPLASRGTVLHRLDRWAEAAEAFDQALQLAPDDEATLRARATAQAERGLRAAAAADFERLAFVLDIAGRAPLAADAARRAAELEPSDAREALAVRLAAAALLTEVGSAPGSRDLNREPALEISPPGLTPPYDGDATQADDVRPDDPWSAALDARRLAALDPDKAEAVAAPGDALDDEEHAGSVARAPMDAGAYDALDALRAGLDAKEDAPGDDDSGGPAAVGLADTGDEAGQPGVDVQGDATALEPAGANADGGSGDGDGEGGAWPGIDLPSPPPPPIEGPPPEPEELLTEAALVLEAGEVDAARDLMLTAVRVHRDAGRIDAALEIALNLLSIAPGEPRVHLAIANLQLDRGWTGVAKEKIDLLVRLTSLTGDTQAEADVHGLASERLRDEPAPATAGR